MDLQTKQLSERNKMGFLGAVVISAIIVITAGLSFVEGFDILKVIAAVVGVANLVFNIVTYLVNKENKKYMYMCSFSLLATYILSSGAFNEAGMYVIVYVIIILIMVFHIQLLSIITAALAVVVTVGHGIYMLSKGNIGIREMLIEIVFVVVASVLTVLITLLQRNQSEENMKVVQSGADAQSQTADAMVQLVEELNQKFVQAQDVSDTLNEIMQTNHVSVSEIAESTKMNAEAIEQQTNQTSDIQQSIQNVGEEARQMGDISVHTNETVEEGVKLINRLKSQAVEVAKINTETRGTTEALNESIKDVQAITETILGISSQTNLLALNASIEAARAGEAGKGFAVVADEIRTLSVGTREATEQISEIIERLTTDAQSAAESMTQSADYAQKQNELIEETGRKLADIKVETDELYKGVVQVNDSVESIISANALIMDSITNLSATGEEVAASTDTALSISDSSMEALKNMTTLLDEIRQISTHMGEVAQN